MCRHGAGHFGVQARAEKLRGNYAPLARYFVCNKDVTDEIRG
jgi:hypothetical protein